MSKLVASFSLLLLALSCSGFSMLSQDASNYPLDLIQNEKSGAVNQISSAEENEDIMAKRFYDWGGNNKRSSSFYDWGKRSGYRRHNSMGLSRIPKQFRRYGSRWYG